LKFKTISFKESIYQGQVDQDDIEQGIGRKINKNNGDVYEGEFLDGF
jgi:hypothetical protein